MFFVFLAFSGRPTIRSQMYSFSPKSQKHEKHYEKPSFLKTLSQKHKKHYEKTIVFGGGAENDGFSLCFFCVLA